MASEKLTKLIEEIKALTVLELSELVKALEQEFGVSAAAPMSMAAPAATAAAPVAEVEEQTEFTVLLKEIGTEKIKVIKVVREVTSLGLKEAKDVVDGAPSTVKENVSKDEANTIAAKFKEVGATVEIK
ncbi:MAG: 50S ribosomal protein L7/L12 [Clostridiales bacterium]|nr:50S ribosomal protein L7/L12 [Clostridiales bacterium]